VPLGTFQFESGASYVSGRDEHNLGIGELNLRVALSGRFEISVQADSYRSGTAGGSSTSGFTDGAVACKIKVFDGPSTLSSTTLRLALQLVTSLPTGTHALKDPRLQPQATLLATVDFSPAVSLSANLGVMNGDTDGERYLQALGGASLGFSLDGAWSGYLELFAWQPGSAGGSTQRVVDTGVQLLLGNDVMLDAHVGRTTGDGPTITAAGLGVSFRL